MNDIAELLKDMNDLLAQGLKVSEAEKQLGYGDGQARRVLSKAGFKCDRKLNRYIPKDNTPQVIDKKPVVTRSNAVTSNSEKQVFTVDQVEILHKIIQEYQIRQHIQIATDENKGKTINRNVRVYEKQYEQFATWCKENNVTQADALYKAINLLMNNKSH